MIQQHNRWLHIVFVHFHGIYFQIFILQVPSPASSACVRILVCVFVLVLSFFNRDKNLKLQLTYFSSLEQVSDNALDASFESSLHNASL